MRNKLIALIGSGALLLGSQMASSHDHAQSAAHHKLHANHHAGYVKPGAAVSLTHDYDGKTELGEFETITATLSHIYEDGVLSAALLASPDVKISAFSPVEMPVYRGSTYDLPIQFSGTINGNFTLSLEAVYKSPEGHESRRVLSIPVNIGGGTFEKTLAAGQAELNRTSTSGVIGLPAREVIE